MENNYTVYCHISPSGKRYIGITSRADPSKRWANGRGYYHNQYFARAIKKYGWCKIVHEILFEKLSKEQAETKEKELILYYKSNYRDYGYNIESGGNSIGKRSAESIRKTGDANKGRRASDEARQKMSDARRGKKRKKASDETKQKIRESHIGMLAGIKNHNHRGVTQYGLDGNFVRNWDYIRQVEHELGYFNTNIGKCCMGKAKTAYGYIWKYSD